MIYLLFLISVFTSIAGAISGIGGGIILKPTLDLLTNLGAEKITFLSGCTVLSMSIVSLLGGRKSGIVIDKTTGTLLAVSAAVGGIIGKRWLSLFISQAENNSHVTVVQSIILCVSTVCVLIYTIFKHKIPTRQLHGRNTYIYYILLGVALGVFSSFLGIGGGPINIIALSYFLGADSKTSAAYSLYIIFFSQTASLIQTVLSANLPEVPPILLLAMICGGIAGGLTGRNLSKRMSNRHVDILFIMVLCIVVGISGYNFFACL